MRRVRLSYERHGLVALRSAVSPIDIEFMARTLWLTMARKYGIKPGEPQTWNVHQPTGFGATGKSGAFAAMASHPITGALNDLLGAGWVRPARWGVPLVTFPETSSSWNVPHKGWHLDGPAIPQGPAVVRVFVILEPIEPRGGGTLVVTGSHQICQRLARRIGRPLNSSEIKKRLRDEWPWFATLTSASDSSNRIEHFMNGSAEVDGVPVRVVEMTGQPGDAFLMHPSALHAASVNASDRPRLMLTQWIDGHPDARSRAEKTKTGS